jgi:hypothetical protein
MRRALTLDKELGIKIEKQWITTWGKHETEEEE